VARKRVFYRRIVATGLPRSASNRRIDSRKPISEACNTSGSSTGAWPSISWTWWIGQPRWSAPANASINLRTDQSSRGGHAGGLERDLHHNVGVCDVRMPVDTKTVGTPIYQTPARLCSWPPVWGCPLWYSAWRPTLAIVPAMTPAKTSVPVAPPCPSCGATHARWLSFTSAVNQTNAFQCLECTHLWMVHPSDPLAAIVAPMPASPGASRTHPKPPAHRMWWWPRRSVHS